MKDMAEGFDLFANFRYNTIIILAANEITPKELSIELGLHPDRIGNFLYPKSKHLPKVEELAAIAKHFNVSMDDIIHKRILVKFISNERQ